MKRYVSQCFSVHSLKSKLWVVKALLSSFISAVADFGISFVVFAIGDCSSGVSAACGAISGGIVNCTLNYKWTFKLSGVRIDYLITRYVLVWAGSLTLNSYGTEFVADLFMSSDILDFYGISRNMRFSAARLLVSAVVSVFWNLQLQRRFVFSTAH